MSLGFVSRATALAVLTATGAVLIACSSAAVAPSAPGAATAPATQTAPGPPAAAPEGTAQVDGTVQRISVDLSQGVYSPTVIRAKAGIPLEIRFGEGRGCLASVLIPDFGVDQDLTAGGATVALPAMTAGEHEFSCGMRMVFGKIVVE